jgi:hypothetical protein
VDGFDFVVPPPLPENDGRPSWCPADSYTWAGGQCTSIDGITLSPPESAPSDPQHPPEPWCQGVDLTWDSDTGVCTISATGEVFVPQQDP